MKIPILDASAEEIVRVLRERVHRIEGARRLDDDRPITTGSAALDRLLPAGGWVRGTLVEWLAGGDGSGAWSLSIIAAREALTGGGMLVVMDRRRQFYPPAAAALGIDPAELIVVRARREQDELWALEQALRCEAVAVAWASLEEIDGRSFRRFQLAAEAGGSLAMLLRPDSARGRPTWSDVQLAVRPLPSQGPRRLRVELVRCRRGASGGVIELEIDETTGRLTERRRSDETHPVHLPAQPAHPTPGARATGRMV